jgi:predicted anti-sigma-YlaC factor YlaD
MSCYDVEKWVLYCRGVLEEATMDEMEEHLYGCERCLEVYLKVVEQTMGDMEEKQLREDFTDELFDVIQEEKREQKRKEKVNKWNMLIYYSAAACITIFLMLSSVFTDMQRTFQDSTEMVGMVHQEGKHLIKSGWTDRLTDQTSGLLNRLIEKE